MNAERKTTFWGIKDQDNDHMTATDPGEAIHDLLDYLDSDEWPETVTAVAYVSVSIPEGYLRRVPIERVLEVLDEEFGDRDGYPTEATAKMLDAEAVFIKAVLAEYVPYTCEPTGEEFTVNTLEWVKENEPEWLEIVDTKGEVSRNE